MSDVVVLRRESIVTIVEGLPQAPVVTTNESPIVVIQREGIAGPRGPIGPTGTVGDTFVYSPPDVSAIWNITHNMERFPIVTVVDTANRIIEPNVTYLTLNILRLDFDIPMTGTAYLN